MNAKPITGTAAASTLPTKHQQVVDLLSREEGATLEEMSKLANWLTHSTRAFLTGLRKRGYESLATRWTACVTIGLQKHR